MKKNILLLCVFLNLVQFDFLAQTSENNNFYLVDTSSFFQLTNEEREMLKKELPFIHNEKSDTTRLQLIFKLYSNMNDNDVWILYLNWIQQEMKKKNTEKLHPLFYDKINASLLNDLGYYYSQKGNLSLALDYYISSLKLKEKLKNKKGMANTLNNIGLIYYNQGEEQKALENDYEGLKIYQEIKDTNGIASSLHNIASIYQNQNDYDKAIINYNKSLILYKSIDNKQGYASSLDHLSVIHRLKGDIEKALEFSMLGLKLREEIKDNPGIANSLNHISEIYYDDGNINKAIDYSSKSLKISLQIGFVEKIRNAAENLYTFYKTKNEYAKALEMHELFVKMRDSIFNKDVRNKAIKEQFKYEYDKREIGLKAEQEKKEIIFQDKNKRQKIVIGFILSGLLIVFIFSIFLFKRYKITQKQKKIIELKEKETHHQKQLIEEKQKEIVDSINYAKRIQFTLLANKQLLDDNLNGNVISGSDKGGGSGNENPYVVTDKPTKEADTRTDSNYFILFKPKDIVSGDFYWATKKTDIRQSTHGKEEIIERFYIAACDSTGHGVPGAFMSLLNISFLNEAVNEKNIVEPHEILNHVRKRLIENMDGGQDGMDCILMCFETSPPPPLLEKKRGEEVVRCTYAAANNSPAIIKNGKLISLPADKMPVGKGEKGESFTLRTIDLSYYSEQNKKSASNVAKSSEPEVLPFGEDLGGASFLYLYTDGYADQFGGPKGKKFKYKQLDELLISISNFPANKQSEILDQRFETWKGNLEQVDDVLIIGIRL